ncbi:hypothetical protein [Biformimicrobium ophioploci]|uniref:Membrane protein n=1 Tax=Biformimicrobium ophioploci TaxID=3036711 RepID=A0ABQ6M0H1_9GAMM|nr:hypothetical protein [Microbulbifer sp. NKW57]GMG87827.1 membrane protein [Microbulbifer sp. NKW57]
MTARVTTACTLLAAGALLGGCATAPPANLENVCEIFSEKKGWYADAYQASKRWNASIPVMMAFVHQESRFVHDARPPRRKILGFIPGPRPSNAYGYSQALTGTWRTYERNSGNNGADRDDFADALDFIGWYNQSSVRRNNIDRNDSYHLYLAYHEGHGGFERRTYRNKPWLQDVARGVSQRAKRYDAQLQGCAHKFPKRRKFLGLF